MQNSAHLHIGVIIGPSFYYRDTSIHSRPGWYVCHYPNPRCFKDGLMKLPICLCPVVRQFFRAKFFFLRVEVTCTLSKLYSNALAGAQFTWASIIRNICRHLSPVLTRLYCATAGELPSAGPGKLPNSFRPGITCATVRAAFLVCCRSSNTGTCCVATAHSLACFGPTSTSDGSPCVQGGSRTCF